MIARLGHVAFWMFSGIAAMSVAGLWGAVILGHGGEAKEVGMALAATAVASWLFGRACRYVLSGE